MRIWLLFTLTAAAVFLATPTQGAATFDSKLFYTIAKDKSTTNIVFSPASIQSCLALAYLGAEGTTATELQTALQFGSADKQQVATKFGNLFDKTVAGGTATFRSANRIYLDERFQLSPKYNELAEKHFRAPAESVKFSESVPTAEKINKWVEEVTANKIQNLISSSSLDASTVAVLVNALYFKAKWAHQFHNQTTSKQDFAVSKTRKVPVDMMLQSEQFLYGELADLDAKVVELHYLDTEVTMLVILPNDVEGLSALEEKLKEVDLTKLSAKLKREEVVLRLPKFKVEFDISLEPVLKPLGITTMFSDNADFSSLLANKEAVSVSEAKHKAFIEVNESGTEAAAATYLKIVPLSAVIYPKIYEFTADHPFVFALKDKENVYFVGHVANF